MKLSEALIERAELKREIAQLRSRIGSNVLVQEGDAPAENPTELMQAYDAAMTRMRTLVQRINNTNSQTPFDATMTIAEAIALRDDLGARIQAYRGFYDAATIRQERYSAKEVKFVRCVDAKALQAKVDTLAKQYRLLDTALQGINWTVELL